MRWAGCIGSLATGGIVGVFAWFVAGSLAAAILLGVVASVVTFLVQNMGSTGPGPGAGRRRYGRDGGWVVGGGGGSWSGGSSSSGSDSGGFSGGGGSFGGGGASGSW